MRKILSLFLMTFVSVMMFAATETTVYYTAPEATIGTYSVKLNVNFKGDGDDWHQFDMTKTALTYNGDPVYSYKYTDAYDGVGVMQFQLFDGETWKSQKDAINSWTGVATYNGKMYVHATEEWVAAPAEGGEEAQMDTIYTWYGKRGESSATEAIEAGGTAAAYGGNSNVVVGTAQKTNWTIKLNKGFSSGTYYVGITLDEALAAGDKLQVAAFRTSGSDAIFGIDFSADEASAATTCQVLFPNNLQQITTNLAPEDTTFTIPECAAGAKFIRIYRNSGSTGVYVANFTILREKGETPEPPVEDPAKFYITGDAALLGESLAWNPAAIKVTEDSYTFENLAAGDYKLKVTVDGTWNTAKGFSDLTIVADGLTADGDGNICFTLAEAGNVEVTYTAEAFTLAGNFYVEPQPQGCDWDNIEYLGDGSPEQTFGSQFKVCKSGDQPGVVNIQKPGFAAESGIYMTFPSAAFGTISLAEGQYVIDGAGIVFYCSAFTEEYTEVTVNCEGNDIVFTVYNAAAAPQPVEHTYTVAGNSAAIFGAEWNPGNTAADMTLVEGIYTFVKEEVELVAGNIEFKVCEDHAWTTAYPAENYVLNIPETGIYTISITFNPDSKEVAAVANKTGDAEIDPTVSVKGGWDSWAAEVAFTLADNKESATGVLNLEAGNYEFKVILNGSDWRSNGYTYHREFTGAEDITGNGDNMVLQADAAGEYTITWTFANNAIAIAFPTATAISNTAADAEAVKILNNGMLLIRKGDKTYTIMGQAVK